jgi:hypothetical protein
MVCIHIVVLDGAGVCDVTRQCQRRILAKVFSKPVRAGIFVVGDFKTDKAPSGATSSESWSSSFSLCWRADTLKRELQPAGICRPDGAGFYLGFGSTKMPRRMERTVSEPQIFKCSFQKASGMMAGLPLCIRLTIAASILFP